MSQLILSGTFREGIAPLTGRSLQYLQLQDSAAPFDPLVSFDHLERQLTLIDLRAQQAGLTDEQVGIIDRLQEKTADEYSPVPALPCSTEGVRLRMDHLADFLVNPAEARLKRQLGLRGR